MGFCSRCGDIVNGERCAKCGGRVIATVSNGLDTVDRWTSHYMNTIQSKEAERAEKLIQRRTSLRPSVLNTFGSINDPLKRRPTLSLQPAPRKTCSDCEKQLYTEDSSLSDPEQREKRYCVDCYQRRFSKGNCRSCFKPVFPNQGSYVSYNSRFWHKECFLCRWCDKNLSDDPLVDLGGAPCCEDCLMKKAGHRPEESPVMHIAEPMSPSAQIFVTRSPTFSPALSPSMSPRVVDSPFSSISDLYGRMDTMSSAISSIRLSDRPSSPNDIDDWSSDKFSTINSVRAPLTDDNSTSTEAPANDAPAVPQSASPQVNPYRSPSLTSSASELSSRPTTPASVMSYASSKGSSHFSSDTSLSIHAAAVPNRPAKNKAKSKHTRERSHSLPPPSEYLSSEPSMENHDYHEDPTGELENENKSENKNVEENENKKVDEPVVQQKSTISLGDFHPPPRSRRNSTSSNVPVSSRCHFCGDFVRGSGVKLPSGELYHRDCLRCHSCRMIFEESKFVMNQNNIYHTYCAPQPKTIGVKVQCPRCLEEITGKYYNIDGVRYHPNCFTCTGCVKSFRSKMKYAEVDGFPYCESCCKTRLDNVVPDKIVPTPRIRTFPTAALTSPNLPIDKPHAMDVIPTSPMSPSTGFDENGRPLSLFSQRTVPLPKFGGSKICPRCHEPVGVLDETPGPKATKCHKKCLQCAGCKKQLDSGALVREDEKGWLPYCRACYTRAVAPRMSMYEQGSTVRGLKNPNDRRSSVMV